MTEKKISRKELEQKHQALKLTLKSKNELNDELRNIKWRNRQIQKRKLWASRSN